MVKVESPVFREVIKKQFTPKVIYFPGSIDLSFTKLSRGPKKEDRLVIGYEGAKKRVLSDPLFPH